LECLLEIYGKGLKAPLPFFPETSLAYAEALSGGKRSEADALRKAENTWMGNERQRGEGDDPYFRLCFGTSSPLDKEFRETALAVFGPLLRHRERIGR
jgi:exodeoxyribonuclease V gamma subunit